MIRYRFVIAAIALVSLLAQARVGAADTREIDWDDLVPAEAEFDDPFASLDDDSFNLLIDVAFVRDMINAGDELDEEMLKDYRERLAELEGRGVDVDELLGMRDEVAAQRKAKRALTNRELDGKQVRLAGYLLPLEFEGDSVTEFFLVPYVGACIHTPPPPPNQIVHVEPEKAVELDGGLYTAIWVEGTIRTEGGESRLSLRDGASNIPSSYALKATSVKPYE